MRREAKSGGPTIVEPVPVKDIFVTGMSLAENAGDHFRFTFHTDRRVEPEGAEIGASYIERVIVARLVLTRTSFIQALRMAEDVLKHDEEGSHFHMVN